MEQTILSGILSEFREIAAIPRPSGCERAIAEYLEQRLARMGLVSERDEKNNLVCDVPATGGLDRAGRLALQAHMDMVAVGTPDYRPLTDPIHPVERDGFLQTDGRSSLGADCGIGLAAALYLLGSGAPHGPLRLIVTTDEERGLAGAAHIHPACLDGCDGLVNLDGFHFGKMVISSAGGVRQTFSKTPELFFPMMTAAKTIRFSGLRGGHSGDDIGLGRGNAARWLIWLLGLIEVPYELAGLSSGTAHNTIPSEASATILIDPRDEKRLAQITGGFLQGVREVYGKTEPDAALTVAPAELPNLVLSMDQRDDFLALAGLIQSGPVGMHPLCPDCVGSSGTLGRVFADQNQIEIYSFLRSCDESWMDGQAEYYASSAGIFGFDTKAQRYGAWPGTAGDRLSAAFERAGKELGIPLERSAVHVGLEASVFHQMVPELPIVSVGMEILDPHSVRERVKLSTVEPFFRLLAAVAAEYR